MKKIFIIIALLALAGGGYWYYEKQQQADELVGIVSSNGRLELQRMDVASLYAGRVEQVLVDEGQNVQQGDSLVRLSSRSVQAQYDAAQAQYEAAQAQYNAVQAQLHASQAQQEQAKDAVERVSAQMTAQEQQLRVAQIDVNNAVKLRQDNLISASELAKRIAARDVAKAQLAAITFGQNEASAGVSQATAGISQITAGIAQAEAGVTQAKAQLAQVQSVLDDLQITAPKAGRVQYKLVETGNVVAAGSPVVSLLDVDDVSMSLFLPGPVINQVALNSEARIVLDGTDYVFPAIVDYVASDAQFTPKFVETDSERAKLMFKVELKIPAEIAHQYSAYLRGGMTGNGYLLTAPDAEWTADLQVKLPDVQSNVEKTE